eukprot:TRINITY_DN7363_c0_g4_i1.p1 TRINITY_DN7363_c0_g4~~TRINITY_DN7363_c0_g4_i1.p1  ORF type:complete len:413 (+),score=96.46 TRINITY_DN7363_c0_g4_i1:48-1241(+)
MGNKSGKEFEEDSPRREGQRGNARQSVKGPVGQKLAMVHRELRALPEEFFENCDSVISIDLSHNKLPDSAVGKFGSFESLTTLILDDNRFANFLLPYMPKLTFLSLNNNHIKELESIVLVLSTRCPELQTLSLVGNPCVPSYEFQVQNPQAYTQYRLFIIGYFKSLKFLDFAEIDAQERESAVQLHEDIAEGNWKLSSLFPDEASVGKPRPKRDRKEKKDKKEKKKKKKEREKEREKARRNKRNGKKVVVKEAEEEVKEEEKPAVSETPVAPAAAETEEVANAAENGNGSTHLSFPEFDAPPPPPPNFDDRQGIDWSSDDSSSGDSDAQLDGILAASSISLRMAASTVSVSSPLRKEVVPAPPPPPPGPEQQNGARLPPPKPDPSQIMWSSDEEDDQ